ncbi:hypothetical protein EIK79_00780 [Halocatena pleomorpha]|uniref:Uncharacterized protein n=1 Tax=Halocatena pleomorpha TaxID=1785090 RepID=A0A3P3RKJ0_9EURY|nr:hypothetical protein EIK79_00780 [Halocatena pleomorpha]
MSATAHAVPLPSSIQQPPLNIINNLLQKSVAENCLESRLNPRSRATITTTEAIKRWRIRRRPKRLN